MAPERGDNKALTKNEFWALQDVCFQVNRAEAFGIIGPNGAGKSTILKLLTGIMEPTKGNMKVQGTLSALIEVGAGFHPDLTGRENIFLNGTILGMKKEQIKEKFDEIVDFSGLADFIDTPVKRYSSGMYARLGFSVAAHVEPDVLIVDEVLSVGDYAFQNKCLERMQAFLKNDTTVIFVSHNLKAVTDLCSRCILLDKGTIIKEGSTIDVVNKYLNSEQVSSIEDKDVFISHVTFYGDNANVLHFESGVKGTLKVSVAARRRCESLSLSVIMFDNDFNRIFDTSTQRLNNRTFDLEEGETYTFLIELQLNVTPGTYHIGVYIYRYDIETTYDMRLKAATLYVHYDKDVRGIVNLYPHLLEESKCGPHSDCK